MFKVTCRCGKSERSFKNNIGDFFIAECCAIAGFDELGNKGEVEEEVPTQVPGDINGDGEVDVEDVKMVIDMDKLSASELKAACDERGISYSANESKANLKAKLLA